MSEQPKRVGPFNVSDDGIYEHMGDEYKGGVWLWTEPDTAKPLIEGLIYDLAQAKNRADFMRRACQEAQDIAATAQESVRKAVLNERKRCLAICEEMEQHWSDYKDTALLNGDVDLSNAASGEPRAARAIADLIRKEPT
jgi:hypothetical protein